MKLISPLTALLLLLTSVSCGINKIQKVMNYSESKNISYLALGDSYTIGESVNPEENFPYQLIDKLTDSANINISSSKIIARTGWTTGDLLEAIKNSDIKSGYDIVTLLIGVNNQFQGRDTLEYATEFEELLKIAIKAAKNNKANVFVLSIPDYGFTKFGASNKNKITKEIDIFNSINKRITEHYKTMYVDITNISRNNDDSMTTIDGLHPSAIQYKLWIEELFNKIPTNSYK